MAEQTLDSLVANEFIVEIDGTSISGVFRVSGLTLFKTAVDTPLLITKMVQRSPSAPMNQWLRETLDAVGKVPTRTLDIVAVDDGVPTRRWTFNEAHIQAATYSDFDSASVEMVEERVAIHYASVTHTWLTE
jgi:hypothetical protein